jgi:hypothetical protein
MAAAVAIFCLISLEMFGLGGKLPQNRRLLPQEITTTKSRDGALQFGFEMGTGLRTYLPTALPLCLCALVVLMGSIPVGLLAGIGFAAGRALMPLARRTSDGPQAWDIQLIRHMRLVTSVSAIAFAVSAVPLVLFK